MHIHFLDVYDNVIVIREYILLKNHNFPLCICMHVHVHAIYSGTFKM